MPDSCVDLNPGTRCRPARADPDGENPTRARGVAWRTVLALGLLAIATAATASAVDDVRLRIEGDAGSYLAWADNTLAGPVEVMLHGDHAGVRGEPALPARATVPAHSSVLVARVYPAPSPGSLGLRLRLETVPGSVNARPRDYEYLFPLPAGEPRIEQAWGGRHSHANAENRHAVDFAAAPGTVVFAARDGIVMRIRMAGPSATGRHGDANLIRILHDDGSMAVYAHLQPGGALVQPGQRVRRGRPIGLSGNSGASSGPHLHFVVQVNRGMHLESIPFRMFGDRGILRFSEPAADSDPYRPL